MAHPPIESKFFHPEIFPNGPSHEQGIRRIVESLIKHETPFDHGTSAEVYQDKFNDMVCYKIYRENYQPGNFRNSSRREVALLEQASKANTDRCRVPVPYAWTRMEVPELENDRDYLGVVELVSMEKLDAVNLEYLLKSPHPAFPENFDPEEFCSALQEFIERLHTVAEVHHRDLRDANIMIDLKTGNPLVIDFGRSKSTAGLGDEDPYQDLGVDGVDITISDMEKIRDLHKRLLAYKLTKPAKV
jgi:serine/threonine protein kinase